MFIWRYFPAIYALPFLLATVQFSTIAAIADVARWGVFVIALLFAIQFRFRRMGRLKGRMTNLDAVAMLFLFVFAASSVWSIDSFYTIQKAVSAALLLFSSFWTFWLYADRYSEVKLLRTLMFPIVLLLAANLSLSWFIAEPYFAGRFQGFFLNPNNIGVLSVVSAGIAYTLWLRQRRIADLVALVIILVNLVLASSRSGLIVLVLIIGLSALRGLARRPIHGLLGLVVIFGSVYVFSQTSFFQERILREDTLIDASNRVYFWALAKDYIANRPFLGHGFGADIIIHEHYGIVLRDIGLRGAGVMSSYYGLAVQLGVPFTLLFFVLIWGYTLNTLVRRMRDYWIFHYGAIIAAGLFLGISEPLLFSAGNIFSFFYWIVFMLMYRRLTYLRRGIAIWEYGELRMALPRARPAGPSMTPMLRLHPSTPFEALSGDGRRR